jgi:hypothetical protein
MSKKFVDLKQLAQQDVFELTLPDEESTVLHLAKPSEGLLIEFMSFEDKAKDLDALKGTEKYESILKMQKDMICQIMSCNKEGVEVDDAYLKEKGVDFYLQQVVLKAYSEWVQEISADPN